MKLVILPAVEADRLAAIQKVAPACTIVNASNESEALAAMPEADAFFGKITPPLLEASKRLRWVQSATVSLEHYIFPALVQHPCTLTNMRGLFSDVIADQVLGYILCFARNLHLYIRNQVFAKWEPLGGETGRVNFAAGPGVVNAIDRAHMHLGGQTVGIVGLGEIGAEIARRAKAFQLRVIAVDPVRTESIPEVEQLWSTDRLGDLLSESDFVVIAAAHTPTTEKLFNASTFKHMKLSAYLINIGRGAIVVLKDLVEALQTKTIAGAARDVFETEPLPTDHPLWSFPNVILTPHVAGYSPRIAERHLAVVLDNLQRFSQGQPLRNIVNKAMWC